MEEVLSILTLNIISVWAKFSKSKKSLIRCFTRQPNALCDFGLDLGPEEKTLLE